MMPLSIQQIDRIVEIAWEDRIPLKAMKFQFDLTEEEIIHLMRRALKGSRRYAGKEEMQGWKTRHENSAFFKKES